MRYHGMFQYTDTRLPPQTFKFQYSFKFPRSFQDREPSVLLLLKPTGISVPQEGYETQTIFLRFCFLFSFFFGGGGS